MEISRENFIIDVPSVDELKPKILDYRAQDKLLDSWLVKRLDQVLPQVMKRSGIDCWVVCNNEYNEEPVFWTLAPRSLITARRLTILVFHLKDDGTVDRMSLTHPVPVIGDYYRPMWTNPKGQSWGESRILNPNAPVTEQKGEGETQMECLARVLKEINPKVIGLDMSKDFAFADGLSHTLYEEMMEVFDDEQKAKVVSAEKVVVGWMETRIDEEMDAYHGIMQIAHAMIAEAFSSKVILPGVTTNEDVKYWMMQKTVDLGFRPWFDYEVSVRRAGVGEVVGETVIRQGDLLHCDVGFRYLNLCTDTQENAYILKQGETDAPEELKKVMATVNRFQDITLGEFRIGRTGNEILAASLKKAKEEGIVPCLYTHPIGFNGHAAGPTIGLWDKQGGVPGNGDYPMYDNTAYSLELNVRCPVESWGVELTFGAETDVLVRDGKVYFLAGRQDRFHLVK